jgi:hypothetical protein
MDSVARLYLSEGRSMPKWESDKWATMDAREQNGDKKITAESITKRLSKALRDGAELFTPESLAAVEKAVASLVETALTAPAEPEEPEEQDAPDAPAPDVSALMQQIASLSAVVAALVEKK